jgi:hypothetical protein
VQACGLDSSGLGQSPVASFSEHNNKPSVFVKGGEFLAKRSDY